MNHLDWVDVVKLTIMTVLPLGLRLGFSKKAFMKIFQDKKLLCKMALFWILSIAVLFLVFKFLILNEHAWEDVLKMVLVIVITLGFRFLFFKPVLADMLNDKKLFLKVSLFWLCFVGFIFLIVNWLT
jgi:hypothetical protein